MFAFPVIALALAAPMASPFDAVEQYQLRKQVTDAMAVALEVKIEIATYRLLNDAYPADAAAANIGPALLTAPERGVASVRVESGTIVLTLGGNIDATLQGRVIGLTPCEDPASAPMWSCGVAHCPAGHPPATGAPLARAVTTVPVELLPGRCR